MGVMLAPAQTVARITNHALVSLFVLASIYVLLIMLLPVDKATMHTYGLTPLELKIINYVVALPSLLIWVAAFIGYSSLSAYAASIQHSPEGQHFAKLARGSAWLAWSLPLTAILALLLFTLAGHYPGFRSAAIITSNYLTLLFPLIAFSLIGTASRGLLRAAKLELSLVSVRIITGLFIVAGVLFCYLTFRHFELTSLQATNNPYHLPLWLMVLTVIVPYLYAWFIGLLAAYEISLVSKKIGGVLYRNSLRLLIGGLVTVIINSIALQYMTGIQTSNNYLSLDYTMVLGTLFKLIGGIGFALIAVGALRLRKIEEV